MRFCCVTLGCKVNQFESQAIESIMASHGHTPVKPGEGSDVCVINTCAVTAESARKSRQAIRRMRKTEPGAFIAVCGCYSQLEPSAIQPLGVDLTAGCGHKREFVAEILANRPPVLPPVPPVLFEDLPVGGGTARTRALLKVQDGCENYCAYCVVPFARGPVRSLPLARAAEQARLLDESGFMEIVVTGIEIASYGKDLEGDPKLTDVVRGICSAAPHARIRLGSLDPGALTEEYCLALQANRNLCNHFHLSLQSGCDDTLKRMGRKYKPDDVRTTMQRLRRLFPDCGITADLITGFPGETEREFKLSMEFIREAEFSDMHIFPYSPRPGTRAAAMPDQVEKSVRIKRSRIAAEIAERASRDFISGQTGKTVEVLFERKRGGNWTGHSDNYLEISVKNGGEKNSIRTVRITGKEEGVIWGEIL